MDRIRPFSNPFSQASVREAESGAELQESPAFEGRQQWGSDRNGPPTPEAQSDRDFGRQEAEWNRGGAETHQSPEPSTQYPGDGESEMQTHFPNF